MRGLTPSHSAPFLSRWNFPAPPVFLASEIERLRSLSSAFHPIRSKSKPPDSKPKNDPGVKSLMADTSATEVKREETCELPSDTPTQTPTNSGITTGRVVGRKPTDD